MFRIESALSLAIRYREPPGHQKPCALRAVMISRHYLFVCPCPSLHWATPHPRDPTAPDGGWQRGALRPPTAALAHHHVLAGGGPLEPYPGYDVPWKVSAYVVVENQVQCIETSAKAKELVFGVVQITEICQLMSTSFMIKIIAW